MNKITAAENLLENRHGVGFHDLAGKFFAFADCIELQRKALGLTQAGAAELVLVNVRTWERWESGKVIPPERTRNEVMNLLAAAQVRPGRRHLAALNKSHHLYWEKHKGWVLRLTVDIGKKVVGKRVKIYLRTYDETEAKRERLVVMSAYRALGVRFSTKVQRSRKAAGAAG